MRMRFISGLVLAAALNSTPAWCETLDRIAITVGNRVIAESAVLLDLRVSAFLDKEPVDYGTAAKRRAAARLVDQVLILQEAADSHVTLQVDEDVTKAMDQIKAEYGSEAEYTAALARYGITEKDVASHLADGFRSLRFSDLRFGPEIQVSEQDLRETYEQLASGWRQKNPGNVPSFEASRDQVKQLITEQRVSEALDMWLSMTRNAANVVYRQQVIP